MDENDNHLELPETVSAEEKYNADLQKEVEKLALYKQAIEEEFKNMNVDDPETHKKVASTVHELIPQAAFTVALLMEHAQSESVRAGLAKWVLQTGMQSAAVDKPKDFISDMFEGLRPDTADVTDDELSN